MVRFQCDSCGKIKHADEAWILGFAAENIGITAARREISIAGSWDRGRAVDPLAVHFCSDECRAKYVDALFGNVPGRVAGEIKVTRRIKRVIPGEVEGPTVVKKTTVRRRKAA